MQSGNGRKSESGIEINTEHVLRVIQDDSLSRIYTFEIEDNSGLAFYNLVIKELEEDYLGTVQGRTSQAASCIEDVILPMSSDYFYWIEQFKASYPAYNFPTNETLIPQSMFNLINYYY